MHQPVLLKEVIDYLDPKPGAFIIDGTINGGGHAEEIFKKIYPTGRLLGIDLDSELIEKARKKNTGEKNIIMAEGNYADLPEILKENELPRADGLILDLGFSSYQLEGSGRGFSFEKDEPLMMTYRKSDKPVAQIIRELKENELADVIFQLSGERYSRKIAKAIKEREKIGPILSSLELAEIIRKSVPRRYELGRINPATRTFQALRMFANQELENLKKILEGIDLVIKSGGRVVIISFHSLEDKLVKDCFRKGEKENRYQILTKKPIRPSDDEVRQNPRSRSARLRAILVKS